MADRRDDDVSEVAYELRSDDEGTTLTVTERQLPDATEPDGRPTTVALASAGSGSWSGADQTQWERLASAGSGSWSGADQTHWELWATGSLRRREIVAVGPAR